MEPKKTVPSPALVEQYRRQLLEMAPKSPPTDPVSNWLDSRFPEPDFHRDRAAMATLESVPPVESVQAETTPPMESVQAETTPPENPPESPFVGYLRVFVFAGEGAEPLEGARVVVSRGDTVYANVTTDRDGFTPVLPLPSVDPALTLTPGNSTPYTAYDVSVTADGFQGVRHQNLPVYGNNYVTQPTPLSPLLPGENPDAMQEFHSGGPENL